MSKEIDEDVLILIKVIPKAKRSEIVGWEEESLKIRVAAQPEKGKANTELIRFLAKTLGIAKAQITLVSGSSSRKKKIRVSGMTQEQLFAQLL